MYIVVFFLVLSISQLINMKMLDLTDATSELYDFTKKDSVIIAVMFAVGCVLQIALSSYLIFILVYAVILGVIVQMISALNIKRIKKQREDIILLYEILGPTILGKSKDDIDFNNLLVTLKYKYGKVNEIKVDVEPSKFNSKACDSVLGQLNNFLNTFSWYYELYLDSRYILFLGDDKPPENALYPGAWLRNFKYMPVGVSGKGEVAWQVDSVKDYGRSLFLDDHGNPIKTDKTLPPNPQGLTAGAPLCVFTPVNTDKGIKRLVDIEVGKDKVYDRNGNLVDVLAKSEIMIPDKMYELNLGKLRIRGDYQHRFPVVGKGLVELQSIEKDDIIEGNKQNWTVVSKEEIEPSEVMCIMTSAEDHLFQIYKTKEEGSVLTRNTGVGKAIYINQEIE